MSDVTIVGRALFMSYLVIPHGTPSAVSPMVKVWKQKLIEVE